MRIPDNYDKWEQHEARQQAELVRLPKCDCCCEPIQDDFCYQIDGEIFCEECLNEQFRKETDSLIYEL